MQLSQIDIVGEHGRKGHAASAKREDVTEASPNHAGARVDHAALPRPGHDRCLWVAGGRRKRAPVHEAPAIGPHEAFGTDAQHPPRPLGIGNPVDAIDCFGREGGAGATQPAEYHEGNENQNNARAPLHAPAPSQGASVRQSRSSVHMRAEASVPVRRSEAGLGRARFSGVAGRVWLKCILGATGAALTTERAG